MNTEWHRQELASGTTRHRLYVDGVETPFFVDHARRVAHYSYGSPIGLWGAGLGAKPPGVNYRIAGFFGGFKRLKDAKAQAVSLATARMKT